MTAQDISRETTNVLLPEEVSSEIWAKTLEESAFMQLARRVRIPGSGVKVQTITGEPTANWVDETASKPVSFHTFGKKTITPYKLAVIEPFSDEFRRDKAALYAECVNRLPKALAKKFDGTIMGTSAPGTGFDVLGSCSKTSILPVSSPTTLSVYDKFLSVYDAIANADAEMNGIALAPQGKSIVLGAKDGQGYPLFTQGVGTDAVGNILGARTIFTKGVGVAGVASTGTGDAGTPAIVGVAGDWDDALWGSVEGIKMKVSDQATLSYTDANAQTVTINLWQQNMFAVMFEIEVAFAVKSTSEFILLTGNTPSAA